MAIAGYLTYSTEIDQTGFNSGLNGITSGASTAGNKVKNIVTALGIDKIISNTFSLMTNSISSAVDRLDTLNNYPKVMQNLGFSAEDTQNSMDKLGDSIDGLPTSLDEIVSNTQQMALSLGDLDKATDVTIALNDAVLTFGGSSSDVTNDINQLNQMISAGTYDEQSWLSINASAPGLLDRVAESIMGAGATQIDLRDALNSGTVSSEEFLDAFVTLDQEGSDSITAFSESVKDATGGIGTATTNLKTRITIGMADIIDSLGNSLENAGFGSLEEIISGLGDTARDTLCKVADFIPGLVDNLGTIVPMLTTVVVGFSLLDPKSIENFGKKASGVFSKISSEAGTVSKVLSEGLGFGALAGLALVALGLLEDNFGDTINGIIQTATENGPEIITNLIDGITSKIPDLIAEGSELLQLLLECVIANLPSIVEGGVSILTSLIEGIASELPSLIPMMLEVILTLITTLLDNVDELISAGMLLLMGLAEGIIDCIPTLISYIPTVITSLVQGFINLFPQIVTCGITLLANLATGLITAIPQLIAMIPQIIGAIINAFKNNDWASTGQQISKGIIEGFTNVGDIITTAVKKVGNQIMGGIKSFFGIKSPSKLMQDEVGKYLPAGIGVGIEANTDSALDAIDDMNDEIMDEMNKAVYTETGAINANAIAKSNNSLLNSTNIGIGLDGNVELDGTTLGRILTPYITKTIKTGGAVW